LYLATLNAASCRKACSNLASYGWFPLREEIPFDSAEQKQSEWKKGVLDRIEAIWTAALPTTSAEITILVDRCLQFQSGLNVEAFVLPAPLTSDPGGKLLAEIAWLEAGIATAKRINPALPVLASIAINDSILRADDATSSAVVDSFLDQLTARGVSGAYIVPVMHQEDSYYYSHPGTMFSLFRMCSGLRAAGLSRIVVSFAGTAGLACLAAGADTWVSGWYRGQRRLRLQDFQAEEGRSVPTYYSHPFGGEFHLAADLDAACKAGYFNRIADSTPASAGLLNALRSGKTVSTVPEWQARPTNVSAAIEHFLRVAGRETTALTGSSASQVQASMARSLLKAYTLSGEIRTNVPGLVTRTSTLHQHGWHTAFDRLLQA